MNHLFTNKMIQNEYVKLSAMAFVCFLILSLAGNLSQASTKHPGSCLELLSMTEIGESLQRLKNGQGTLDLQYSRVDLQSVEDVKLDLTVAGVVRPYLSTSFGKKYFQYLMQNLPTNPQQIKARQAAVQFLVDNPSVREKLGKVFSALQAVEKRTKQDYISQVTKDENAFGHRVHIPEDIGLTSEISDIEARDEKIVARSHWARTAGMFAPLLVTALVLGPQNASYYDVAQYILSYAIAGAIYGGHQYTMLFAADAQKNVVKLMSQADGLARHTELRSVPYISELMEVISKVNDRDRPDSLKKFNGWLQRIYGSNVVSATLRTLGISHFVAPTIAGATRARIEEIALIARAFSELEVLYALSMSSVKYGQTMPEVITDRSRPIVEIEEGHNPFFRKDIPEGSVPNSIALGVSEGETRKTVEMVTGPNGYGKSGYIQMVAGNIVLAQLGAMVPARSMRFTPVTLLTNAHVKGDTENHLSKFMEAGKAFAHLYKRAQTEPGLKLIMFDEMFDGTSELERKAAETAVHQWLADSNHVAIVATHQRGLVNLTERFPNIRLTHVSDNDSPERKFRVEPGPSQRTNASEVLRDMGVPANFTEQMDLELQKLRRDLGE